MPVFTRSELYDLLWSAPASKVAKDLRMSDVALGKAAKRHGIPTPERGYWAKIAAGKHPAKSRLPPRGLGQADSIHLGREEELTRRNLGETDVDIPAFPAALRMHDESLHDLRSRLEVEIGTISIPKSLSAPHPVVARMLTIDAKRMESLSGADPRWSHEQPYYASPYEKRRLRLLSAIFKGLSNTGLEFQAKGKDSNEFRVFAREGSSVTFRLDHPKKTAGRDGYFATSKPDRPASEPLKLEIMWWSHSDAPFRRTWEDERGVQIEEAISEIVVTLAFAVEAVYRQSEFDSHRHAIEMHEIAVRRREEKRIEKILEREAADEADRQARVHKLISDATNFRLAQDIRDYADAVVRANEQSSLPVPHDTITAWQEAAIQCADEVDPVVSRAFLAPPDSAALPAKPMAPPLSPNERLAEATWHPNQKWFSR